MLKKHGAALNFTCVELRTLDQHEGFPEALADPEGLVWQVGLQKLYSIFCLLGIVFLYLAEKGPLAGKLDVSLA
jgi:hypothetical protein